MMRRGLRAAAVAGGCGSVAFFRKRLAVPPPGADALGARSSSWSASSISASSSPLVRPPPLTAAAAGSRWSPLFSVGPAEEEEEAGSLAFFMCGGAGEAGEGEEEEKGRLGAEAWG